MNDDDNDENPKPSLATLLFFLGVVLFLIMAFQIDRCSRAHADELPSDDPLVLAVMDLEPTLTMKEATQHVALARAAVVGTPIEVEQVLGMTQAESSFDRRSVSRLECVDDVCHRKLGALLTWTPNIKGPYFCGVMQVGVRHSRKLCDRLRLDVPGNYVAGVQILMSWYKHPLCRKALDRMYCALLGYGGGKPLILQGHHRYPGKVERRTQRLKRAVARHASS